MPNDDAPVLPITGKREADYELGVHAGRHLIRLQAERLDGGLWSVGCDQPRVSVKGLSLEDALATAYQMIRPALDAPVDLRVDFDDGTFSLVRARLRDVGEGGD